MKSFWKRDNDGLAGLEQQLRARRSEPSTRFVRSLARRAGATERRWFQPKPSYALLALLSTAVLAAGASAGGYSVASSNVHHAYFFVSHFESEHHSGNNGNDNHGNDNHGNDNHGNNGNGNGNGHGNGNDHHGGNDPGDPRSPGNNQYRGQCGLPPRERCVVEVEPDDPSVTEGDSGTTAVTLTVSLSGFSDGTINVAYSTADGTATIADNDYQAASGTLHFAFGQKTQTITLLVNGDTKIEPDESFATNFSSSSIGAVIDGDDTSIITTIKNDDVAGCAKGKKNGDARCKVKLDPKSVSIAEGNSGTIPLTFSVSLNPNQVSDGSVNVAYTTVDGTATAADSDYVPASGTLNFPAGATSEPITVLVNGDTKFEPNEKFFLEISSPDNSADVNNGHSESTITIKNDDPEQCGQAPNKACKARLDPKTVSVTEGNSGTSLLTFTVSLDASVPSDGTVDVSYSTVSGTATGTGPNADYIPASGSVNFPAGATTETFTVAVKGDTSKEPDEKFFVNVSSPDGSADINNGHSDSTVTIKNDDH